MTCLLGPAMPADLILFLVDTFVFEIPSSLRNFLSQASKRKQRVPLPALDRCSREDV